MITTNKYFIPVIVSGGTGSRLWPVSRVANPKPFMKLTDGLSLLQKTFLRASSLSSVSKILTVTNRDYFFKTKDEYLSLKQETSEPFFLLEPVPRSTLAAIALAACDIRTFYGGDAVMLIMPADHLIVDEKAFKQAVNQARRLAEKNHLVIFGIKPDSAETGYGYIECGSVLEEACSAYQVLSFKEKPSLETAQAYLTSDRYLWNSGLFCFKAETILKQIELHVPDDYPKILSCWEETHRGLTDRPSMLEMDASFSELATNSIDYAVMEKAKDVIVIAGNFDWSDMGSWESVRTCSVPDDKGNCVQGEAVLIDVENSYVQSEERLVAVLGLDNLLVVDTSDALLIAKRDRAEDVKQIVNQLKQMNHASYQLHKTVLRPWGTYTVLEEGKNFKIKRIVVKPGATLSLQVHRYRSEHWVVVDGMAYVVNGNDNFFLNTNESAYIPVGNVHRLENPGLIDLVIIEVQSGSYVGEDDIIRLEDNYGRASSSQPVHHPE